MEMLFNSVIDFYFNIGAKGVFAICIISAFVVFLITILKATFKRGYGVRRKIYYLIFVLGLSVLEFGVTLLSGEGIGLCVITLGFGVLSFSCVLSIRVKEQTRKEQRALVKLIDDHINEENQKINVVEELSNVKAFEQPSIPFDTPSPIRAKENITKKLDNKPLEIDFTHVKNVIERLEFLTLSPNDRKQVKDLETAVYTAERGEFTEQVKIKINDGLSALLKIMAKYGI